MPVGGFLPLGPTVLGPTVHLQKVDSWAPKCGQLGPGQLGPGAQLSTFSGWTIGPRTVGPWGRNPPTDTYPPIVGRIYLILVYKFN